MCTRTKTSYGCGHSHRSTEECRSPSSHCIQRFHFMKEGDCRDCKRGGNFVTRGRDGMGRYAQELKTRDVPPFAPHTPLAPISHNIQISPWARPNKKEREFHGSLRSEADDAWEREHVKREHDLQARSQAHSARSSPSISEAESARQRRQRDEDAARLQHEIKKIEDAERIRVRRRADRQGSYDSFQSLGSSRSGSGGHSYDSGFVTKTDPYAYQVPGYQGLGHGLVNVVRDSGRRWARW